MSPRSCSPSPIFNNSPKPCSSLDISSYVTPPLQYTLGSIKRNLDGNGFQLDVVATPAINTERRNSQDAITTNWERTLNSFPLDSNFSLKSENLFFLDNSSSNILAEPSTSFSNIERINSINLEHFVSSDFVGEHHLSKCEFDSNDHQLHSSDFDSEIQRFSADFETDARLTDDLDDTVTLQETSFENTSSLRSTAFETDSELRDHFDGDAHGITVDFDSGEHGLMRVEFDADNHLVVNSDFDAENCLSGGTDFDDDNGFRAEDFETDHLSHSPFGEGL